MSNIKQLIFTSTPIGLEPGRSGYCTVARSQDLSKKEIREIEKLSVLDYSISKSSPPKVYSFRTIQTKSSFYYLLSRIKSCGVDYSNRTNYIAHHLIIEPESIKDLPSPSEIFQYWEGWKDNWDGNPKYLHDDLFSELSKLKPENQTSCNSWQVWTGDSKNAKIPLMGHSIFRTQKNEEDKLINLFSESCSSLDQKENSWNYTFTTFLQLTDDSVDFIWIGGWENSPADKIGITPEIHFFDLDRFDESLIHEAELPITKEVQEETNSPSLQSEENTTNLESEIKDTHQIDEPNVKESSIFEESITEEIPVLPLEVDSKETTDASSWKPEQQEPTYKPVENVPIEQSNEQITEQTQSSKSLTKLDSNEKPPKVSVKTIKPLSRAQKPKDLSIQKKKNLNVTPGKQFPIITIPFFIVSFVLFCIIFFLLGKVNELEKQNDQLNGLIKKFFEPSSKESSNNSPPISQSSPFGKTDTKYFEPHLENNSRLVINLTRGGSITWPLGKLWIDPGYSAVNEGKDLTAYVETASFVDVNTPGQYKVIYTIKDPKTGVIIDSVERFVTVINSKVKPVVGSIKSVITKDNVPPVPLIHNEIKNERSNKMDEGVIFDEKKKNPPVTTSLPVQTEENANPPGFRTWTNKNGIKIAAKLIQIYKDKIKIKRIDGAEFISTISTFSEEDQDFIKKVKENPANIQVRPPQVPLVNKPKPIPVNRPNPKFNDYPKGLHDRTWTDKGGNKIQAYVWGYVPEADAICLVKNTPDGPNLLYPKTSEMKFSVADENYLKAFTNWRESVLRPYREKLPEMVRIPAGKFLMGSPPFEEGRKSDETQHEVTISNNFLMGKYEVTVGQWVSLMGESSKVAHRNGGKELSASTVNNFHGAWYHYNKLSPAKLSSSYYHKFHEKTPAFGVYYGDVVKFCQELTKIHRTLNLIPQNVVYRLPTEAEWEYALRAGTKTAYFWGNNRSEGKDFGISNDFWRQKDKPIEVGTSSKGNPWGIYGMVDSVAEFLYDNQRNYDEGGNAFNKNTVDPVGPIPKIPLNATGGGRVIHEKYLVPHLRCNSRTPGQRCGDRQNKDSQWSEDVGFRIVLAKPIK